MKCHAASGQVPNETHAKHLVQRTSDQQEEQEALSARSSVLQDDGFRIAVDDKPPVLSAEVRGKRLFL